MIHVPRKRFGQHFLRDPVIVQRIIAAIGVDESAPIVEIGPGRGALTLPLLQARGALDVVEIDRDLAAQLRESCSGHGQLTIHVMDALQFDFCALRNEKIKIVGNLPFNISTPLLFHLLDNWHCIESMVFMLQKEVVDRLCARPDTKSYGRLTVMVQAVCAAQRLFDIHPGAFIPPPKVAASIVVLKPKSVVENPVRDPELFSCVVREAFSHRRKTIQNALRGIADAKALIEAGIAPYDRAEHLAVENYVRLANSLHGARIAKRKTCG
jgi:16S rRNA (adenine1518-N6/adenine1519-N6)-dimethyltransferase